MLPAPLRQRVMYLVHDPPPPLSIHMELEETYDRITACFYWPSIKAQVQHYCAVCRECQLHHAHIPRGGLLQPMPIVTVPFEQIGIDIVGPLVQSAARHKFLLVIIEYTTWYPEVIPLQHTGRNNRQEISIGIHPGGHTQATGDGSRLVLHERGTPSHMEVFGVQPLRTSIYHPQISYLIERFNGTLQQMLWKFIGETRKDWPQWVPFLLFAMWEVTQASTGFSLFPIQIAIWSSPEGCLRHPQAGLGTSRDPSRSPYIWRLYGGN